MKRFMFFSAAVLMVAIFQHDLYGSDTEMLSTVQAKDLRCEYRVNPLGIDVIEPRLSWVEESNENRQKQSAYQVLVAASQEKLGKNIGDLWDSGKVYSDQSVHVVYDGKELISQMPCFWKVRIWDKDGKRSPWSSPAEWSMGLLESPDWTAQWIGQDMTEPVQRNDFSLSKWIWFRGGNPAVKTSPGTSFFRRSIVLSGDKKVVKAHYLITADNRFSLYVNGEHVGSGDNAKNGYTYDVSSHLVVGKNSIAVAATNRGPEENPAGLIGVLRIEFQQGGTLIVPMDSEWRAFSKETSGWKDIGFDDSGWGPAQEIGDCGKGPWGDISLVNARTRLSAPMLRREFAITKKVKRATVYVCGLGFFELHLNGKKVGNHIMDPGLTEYNNRSLYVTFDVTDRLNPGANAMGAILGNGRFFAPRASIHDGTRSYGFPKLLLQMRIEYEDGATQDIVSDKNWKLTWEGPIRANNEFDGEEYDARMEKMGWDRPGFDDSEWQNAELVEPPKGIMQAQMIEPMRVTQTVQPIGIRNPKSGMYMVDMGQAFYGAVRLKVRGPEGARVVMRSAYSLRADGTLKTEDNRGALCTDIYTLKGEGAEIWQPKFKGQGYRHVEVTGFPGVPTVENFEGLVIHTDMDSVGNFECSSDLLNQLFNNVRWGQRMYRRSVPLDPDRDERQGWLGDQAKDAESDAYNFNVASFFAKWLQDIRMDQRMSGEIPDVSPAYYPYYSKSIVWPSVITIIPEWFYNFYGDKRILVDNYESMKKFVLFISEHHQKTDFTVDHNKYGDWCDTSTIGSGESEPVGATSGPLISTAYYYNNVRITARTAQLLGKTDDAIYFSDLAEKIKAGFNNRFFYPQTNTYESATQCSYVLPLAFGLVPPQNKDAVVSNLVEDIRVGHDGHLSVGLIGMQWLMQVLSDNDHPEIAYMIAAQTTRPSWGYMASKDATSIWERWDSDTRGPGMNSEGLLMLAGNLEAWFYQTLAGINLDRAHPGFKHIILRPQTVGDVTFVKANFRSMYGLIRSDWEIKEGTFSWEFTIPANTTATIYIPTKNAGSITGNGLPMNEIQGIEFLRMENGTAVYNVGSGGYTILSEK